MQAKIQQLIEDLGLLPHPEGGFYKETYRSADTTGNRSLMTCIYFLLTSDNVSRFHRIKSDELWFHHAGSNLIVHTLSAIGYQQHLVGSHGENGAQSQLLVTKNTIFGSSIPDENSYALVSCVVAPGFDFADFELFTAEQLLADFPEHKTIIQQLT